MDGQKHGQKLLAHRHIHRNTHAGEKWRGGWGGGGGGVRVYAYTCIEIASREKKILAYETLIQFPLMCMYDRPPYLRTRKN